MSMGVRVKVEIKAGNKAVVVPALVNSGYEAEGPELSIPVAVARELDLWPPRCFIMAEADTAGGPAHVYVLAERGQGKAHPE